MEPTEKDLKSWESAQKSWSLKFCLSPLEIFGDDMVTGLKLGVNKLQVHVNLMQIMTCELLQISGDDRHCNRSEVKSK